MSKFLVRQWFLVALAVILALGFGFSADLKGVANSLPTDYMVAAVLFMMALPLKLQAIGRALRYPRAVLLAITMSYLATPLLAWGAGRLWGFKALLPDDLANGLMIAATLPCTMASASVWTRRAGGDDAVSQLVTLVTNMTCFLVTPWWLALTTGTHVQLDPWAMMLKLSLVAVLPMTLAQLLRGARPVADWADRHKLKLSVIAQVGILCFVFVGAVNGGLDLRDRPAGSSAVTALDWLAMLAAVAGVHLTVLSLGFALGRPLGLARAERIAVAFSGSQKTLAVGITIALKNFGGGLALMPLISFHVLQLLLDTLVADAMRRRGPPESIPPIADAPETAAPLA